MTAPFAEDTEAKSMSWPDRARGGKSGVRSRMACPPMRRSGTLRSAARRAVRAAVSKGSLTPSLAEETFGTAQPYSVAGEREFLTPRRAGGVHRRPAPRRPVGWPAWRWKQEDPADHRDE